MHVVRSMTDALYECLTKGGVIVSRVENREERGDSDVIHLHDDYVLAVDYEDYPVICISLDERMSVGGNITVSSWLVKDKESLTAIVSAARQV